ncbi:unnamed protein product [Peronospora destructor]|uniref:Uncharacterized protein n=1 Tax=Peronospora destructor TaxID=86335 RepID=A0AAV0TS68_9STRA|nr:unnamed protein product [Peronospora destructor]
MKEESVVMLTDLLLSKLSEDSSAVREIVLQIFCSLLLLLNDACLTTITNVLQPTAVAKSTIAGEEDKNLPLLRVVMMKKKTEKKMKTKKK